MRKRLPVDEGASAVVFRATILVVESHANIGSVEEISVAAIAHLVCRVDGPGGDSVFDPAKPGGLPAISADVSKLRALGWSRARAAGGECAGDVGKLVKNNVESLRANCSDCPVCIYYCSADSVCGGKKSTDISTD